MYIAIEIATVILEMLLLSIYLKGLYQNYIKSTSYVWAAYVISGIVLCVLSILPIHPMIRLSYGFVSFFALAVLLFGAKWMHAFYSALLLCVINIAVDYTISTIIMFFGIPADTLEVYGNNRVLYIVLAKLVLFFFVFLVIRISKWKKSHDSLFDALPLLMCQVFSIFICYFMYLGAFDSAKQITWSFIIGAIGILYINIIIFLYVERIKEVSEIKRQNELADLQYQLKVEYFNQIKNEQDETRALWHDIKKYLNTMNELMNMNDIPHAKECIDQVADLFGGIGNVVDVGNTVVGAVMNQSVQKAQKMNIETALDIRVQPELNISAADLSVIIGNTFDNAIKACSQLEDTHKKITVQLIQKGSILFYEIKNRYKSDVEADVKDSKLHGFGLKNVKRCIDKYLGTMNVYANEPYFVVSIHINIPLEERVAQLVS